MNAATDGDSWGAVTTSVTHAMAKTMATGASSRLTPEILSV
jgi:hypothetical protein